MNQTTRSRRRPAVVRNGHAPTAHETPSPTRAQARELDAMFKSVARQVLVDDDPAAELPLRQFRVCMALFDGPRSMSELSRELGVSQSAITQMADRLQAAGMVTRLPGGGDRRVRSLQLTARAREMLQLREQRRLERVERVLARMPTTARAEVLSAMSALRAAAENQ